MKKTFVIFIVLLLFSFCLPLSACKKSFNDNTEEKVMINDINYTSLSQAVQNAKDGDIISICCDITENKNVIINKTLSIVGKTSSNKIKPKFYGSITVDCQDENALVSIKNIDIIHPGKSNDNAINNTLIGINLIDGGLTLKSCKISANDEADTNASGVIVSRKATSINNMPITISGNSFGNYKMSDTEINGALIVKTNEDGKYKNITLPYQELAVKNTFKSADESTCFAIIDYSTGKEKIPYIITSSADTLLNVLQNYQTANSNTYTLYTGAEINAEYKNAIDILQGTSLTITGNKALDFNGIAFEVYGSVFINSTIKNATFNRKSSTASITFGEEIDQSNVVIN